MLTTLKDIIRPTWKNVGWTIGAAVVMTHVGVWLMVLSVHGSEYFEYAGRVFVLPGFLLSKLWDPNFGIFTSLTNFLLFTILQFLYLYVPVSLVLHFYYRGKSKRGGLP